MDLNSCSVHILPLNPTTVSVDALILCCVLQQHLVHTFEMILKVFHHDSILLILFHLIDVLLHILGSC